MAKNKPIALPLSGTCDASGDLTLKTRPMEPGKLLCVQQISAQNMSTDNCLVDVGFERAGLQIWLVTLVLTTSPRIYNHNYPIWVPSDYLVVLKFFSAGNKKVCNGWVYGYLAPDAAEE